MKEQLITEIKKLKSEIEELNNDKFLSVCSKQVELKKKQNKLARLEKNLDNLDGKTLDNNTNKNDFPTSLVAGGAVLVIGLIGALIIRKKRKR